MSKKFLAVAAFLLIGTAVGLIARANDTEGGEQNDAQAVSWKSLPAPVRAAFAELAGKTKVENVSMEDEDGVKVYEGSWQFSGVAHEATVTENGDLIETEEVIELSSSPKSVQRAAAKAFPKGTKVKLEKKTIVLYELEAKLKGREKEILLLPTGQQVELEQEDSE